MIPALTIRGNDENIDEQGILRISVGGGDHLPVTLNYCTIRGSVGDCIKMLEMALDALRDSPE